MPIANRPRNKDKQGNHFKWKNRPTDNKSKLNGEIKKWTNNCNNYDTGKYQYWIKAFIILDEYPQDEQRVCWEHSEAGK